MDITTNNNSIQGLCKITTVRDVYKHKRTTEILVVLVCTQEKKRIGGSFFLKDILYNKEIL